MSDRLGWRLVPGIALIVISILYWGSVWLGSTRGDDLTQARITQPTLSNLPVVIADLQACGCWDNYDGLTTKKIKARLTNNLTSPISISGGDASDLRLVVAFPPEFEPRIDWPDASDTTSGRAAMPAGVDLKMTTSTIDVLPMELIGADDLFGVPEGFRIWAIPPTENLVVKAVTETSVTYPTVVSSSTLYPGETFYSSDYGHGVWNFLVPLPPELQPALTPIGGLVAALPTSELEKYVVQLGLAVFSVDRQEIVGFAPSPSVSTLSRPTEF